MRSWPENELVRGEERVRSDRVVEQLLLLVWLLQLRLGICLVNDGALVAVGSCASIHALLDYLHRRLRWLGCQLIVAVVLLHNRLIRLLLVAAHRAFQLI